MMNKQEHLCRMTNYAGLKPEGNVDMANSMLNYDSDYSTISKLVFPPSVTSSQSRSAGSSPRTQFPSLRKSSSGLSSPFRPPCHICNLLSLRSVPRSPQHHHSVPTNPGLRITSNLSPGTRSSLFRFSSYLKMRS